MELDTKGITSFFSSLTLQKLLTGLGVFLVGALIINIALRLYARYTERFKMSPALRNGLRTLLKILLWALLLIGTAGTIGVNISSLVALFSIFSLAISLAVQGTLANIAGGLQVLASHPFSVGDYVQVGQDEGTVCETGLVYTRLTAADNREIFIPNSVTASCNIINYTVTGRRRVEIKLGLSYEADPARAKEALLEAVKCSNPLENAPEAPFVAVYEYKDSAVEYIVRFWTTTKDYWTSYFSFTENVWNSLRSRGLEIPYPQMDVHMKK